MSILTDHPQLTAMLSNASTAFEQSMDSLHRKQTGSYYTALELTVTMMQELVDSFSEIDRQTLYQKKFLEPCVGTGNFVFAYILVCSRLGFTKEQYAELINNIFVCDINQDALSIYRKCLDHLVLELFDIKLGLDYYSKHIGSGLLVDVDAARQNYISLDKVFSPEIIGDGFDIVATNPPYKNLKAEKSHYPSLEEYELDKSKYTQIGRIAAENFTYATNGTINLYKLFVEEIIERYINPTGTASLLIPVSILSDKTCERLRIRLLETTGITSIRIISEGSCYVDASQALCAVLLHKGKKSKTISVDGSFAGDRTNAIDVDVSDIVDESTGNAILVLTKNEYAIRKQMMKHPTIGQLSFIINMRGELDVTLNKSSIQEKPTDYPLIRGRNISYYDQKKSDITEYVSPSFVEKTAKATYIQGERLVCQQIANMAKKRRIAFTPVAPNTVLANSCNFICVNDNLEGVDSFFLLGVLNSTLIDWFFKLTSSNNHINNYEIDRFPIPISYKNKESISRLVRVYLNFQSDEILERIDELVQEAYGITIEEQHSNFSPIKDVEDIVEFFQHDLQQIIPAISISECKQMLLGHASMDDIVLQHCPSASRFEKKVLSTIQTKYTNLSKGELLNHTTFKLSDLDLEMIRSVPQGGSWKNIPPETVQKSKRLSRITQTGGRTTLYGRIDYNKPSYTITTYYNRPGNGTYVHPVHQRVISVREAARFQSFPDSYYFYGSKSDHLKQVGNAVPVIMAYSIGKAIVEKTGCNTSVDLFSGAGGMTYGFKLAGIQAIIANDIEESACITLKANSPEIPVLCGDITEEETKSAVIQAGLQSQADIICGGPPCQGFSLAGFRNEKDPRNQLFRHFVDVVSRVNPKVIVFENVEGLLSYQNGETYRNIIQLFSELGYIAEGRTLMANEYGVPQRRKRVIILCTRKDLGVIPSDIYPSSWTPVESQQSTAFETISDLENIECNEHAKYAESKQSNPLLDYFRGKITVGKYIERKTQAFSSNHLQKLSVSQINTQKELVVDKIEQMSIFDLL